jgi:hypothetical protein
MRKLALTFTSLLFFFSTPLAAQTGDAGPPVVTAFAVLTEPLEAKTATEGQAVVMRTVGDVVVNKVVVIPRGSKLLGRVVASGLKGKGVDQTTLSLVVDKAVWEDGKEIPLQAIIAAVAAPRDNSLASDPTYGMMHSNEPKMLGLGPNSDSVASKSSSTAPVATANIKGVMDEPLLLKGDSAGAVGYEGLSISWLFVTTPPVTVFKGKGKNVRLNAKTQVLLRMAPPTLVK